MDKYGRELDLIVLLADAKRRYTAQQLAGILGVTRRNLYYYLEYLRDCGFHLVKQGACYYLESSSPFFRRLHENISLTQQEAEFVHSVLGNAVPDDYRTQVVRAKLERTYHLAGTSNPDLLKRVNRNTVVLREAMNRHCMAMLRNYSSPHSRSVSDRIVEPFLFMNSGHDVRCHEISSHTNKTFRLARIESVELMDVPWIHEEEHKQVFTDMFMFSGEEKHHVSLRLGQLSRNLLVEEYPLAEPCISDDGSGRWIFSADVVSFLGIGRFVLGLFDDIEVLDEEAFCSYIAGKVAFMGRKTGEQGG